MSEYDHNSGVYALKCDKGFAMTVSVLTVHVDVLIIVVRYIFKVSLFIIMVRTLPNM